MCCRGVCRAMRARARTTRGCWDATPAARRSKSDHVSHGMRSRVCVSGALGRRKKRLGVGRAISECSRELRGLGAVFDRTPRSSVHRLSGRRARFHARVWASAQTQKHESAVTSSAVTHGSRPRRPLLCAARSRERSLFVRGIRRLRSVTAPRAQARGAHAQSKRTRIARTCRRAHPPTAHTTHSHRTRRSLIDAHATTAPPQCRAPRAGSFS